MGVVIKSLLISVLLFAAAVAQAAVPPPTADAPLAEESGSESIILAGGCFWGLQAVFKHVKGVTKTVAGYAGGDAGTAQYDKVNTGMTGHAEAVKVTYDPSKITPGQLLRVFFAVSHDPTQLNRQGPDVGTQYRSAIFFATPQQEEIANAYIAQLGAKLVFPKPIVTKVEALKAFYAAEPHHQDYVERHPESGYVVAHDLPKLARLKKEFPALYVK